MRVILVPVADRPECAGALNTAFSLGNRLGASVSGCHMRPHKHSEVTLSMAFADSQWRKRRTKKAPVAAKSLYESAAKKQGFDLIRRARMLPGALWSERVGSPSVLMGIVGPVSDLIVVSRPQRRHGIAEMFMSAALLESAAPVLMLPASPRAGIGKRIVIGWNQSTEAARTVSASMPLLKAAEEVTIVSCGPENHPGPKAAQLAAYLTHWGIKSKRIRTPGRKVTTELVDAYRKSRGDLLIAGAYSRSRWREKIFGGTTEFLLREARMPVLMMHH